LSSLKSFLIEEGYLAPGLANMILLSTVPGTLKDLKSSKTSGSAPVPAVAAPVAAPGPSADTKLSEANAKLSETAGKLYAAESRLGSLENKVKVLESRLAAVSSAPIPKPTPSSLITESQNYVKELSAENAELKQKLLQSEQTLWSLQQDMQSKLDSAKAVAQELNVKLMDRSVQNEAYERMKVLEKERDRVAAELSQAKTLIQDLTAKASASAAAPAPAAASATKPKKTSKKSAAVEGSTSTRVPLSPATAQKLIEDLREMKGYQLRKKSKKELEDIAEAIGAVEPGFAASVLKAELAELIEAVLAEA